MGKLTILLLHGLGQTAASWEETVSFLDCEKNVNALDLSTLLTKKDQTYENLYSGFSSYCNQIDGPVHLCGLSLGAVLSLQYALEFPEKVASIALIGGRDVMPKALLTIQNSIFRLMPQSVFQKIGLSKKEFMQLIGSMRSIDFSNGLSRVVCPTIVICGEKDFANKSAAKRLAANIPNAELTWIKGAGHEVNQLKPKQLAMAINEFYQKGSK
ncbi:hypothetical protein JCM19045_214 [Bacillus sp. JCM 19045]|nr:hypothetical protein JCM19045_214 [Bacillus sp. JCM 19045]